MEIFVYRYDGARDGEDIIEPLLAVEAAGIARGTQELDEQSVSLQDVVVEIVLTKGLRLGHLVEVVDSEVGAVWLGKIKGITHSVQITEDEVRAYTTLNISKPNSFYV